MKIVRKTIWYLVAILVIGFMWVLLYDPDQIVDPQFNASVLSSHKTAIVKPIVNKPAETVDIPQAKSTIPVTPVTNTVQNTSAAPVTQPVVTETPAAPSNPPDTDQSSTDTSNPSPTCVGNEADGGNDNCEFNPAITDCINAGTCGKND